jgi:hypothetical protein
MGIDIAVNVTGQADVLLPEYDIVTREEHEEPHKAADTGKHKREESAPDPPGNVEPWIKPQAEAKQKGDHQNGQNQPVVAHYRAEIPRDSRDRRRRRVAGLARFPEEKMMTTKNIAKTLSAAMR